VKKEKGLCRFASYTVLRTSNIIPRYCISIPVEARTGPEGSRRFRLPDFKALDTWRW